jgi:chorismate synthase
LSSCFGNHIRISIFGQSHSPAIGVTIDGLPAGFPIDFSELGDFLRRRAPGGKGYSTARTEPDEPEIISGLVGGVTCGTPLTAVIRNTDARSSDYARLRDVPRPSHADYSAYAKYGAAHDIRGGGAFSGRLTAPLCVAGGICLQLLKRGGIGIAAHIAQIGSVRDRPFDPVEAGIDEMKALAEADFPVLDAEAGRLMRVVIDAAKQSGDSIGGIVECAAIGVPAGTGEPMFDGMENRIASAIFGIPAVRGIEFGGGFAAAELRGSENNDAFIIRDGEIHTRTNRHGGILGGVASGMPILFRVAFKPTPSISIEQDSVSISLMKETKLKIEGRHDPCVVPRAVPCVEAAAAIAIYDALAENRGRR